MIGWRKWALVVFVSAAAFALCAAGKMTDSIAAQLIGASVVAYMGGNVGAKLAAGKNGHGADTA